MVKNVIVLGITSNALNRHASVIRSSRDQLPMAENNEEKKSPLKLEIDRPQDFKFHIAYDVYSRAWDQNVSDAARLKLNELTSALANDENGYSDFYAQIQDFRRDTSSFRSGRTRFESKRKRDWQRTESRDGRDRRHK